MDKLPRVSLGIIVVIVAQIAGVIFWGANILRDISDNSEKIDVLLEVLVETEDDLILVDEKLQENLDKNTIKLVNDYYTEMIKLQARVAILEKTIEFTRKDGM
jgi:Na+-translocating ferredoxin:NAD+ oxidoreductase RnfG subunit